MEQTQGTETSKYLEENKSIRDSESSGERNRNSLNQTEFLSGVAGHLYVSWKLAEPFGKTDHRG